VRRAGVRANDPAFDHAMAGWRVRNEAGWHGHFDDDVFVAGDAFYGDEGPARANIDRGAEFKNRAAVGCSSVYKNGKSDRQPLPASSLIFWFAHGNIVLCTLTDAEITQVAARAEQVHWTLVTSMRARLILIPIVLLATFCAAADTPNFSGIWKLDPTKSDFGPQTPPESAEYVVRHVGATISFNYTQDGKTTRVDLTPDNEERITSENEETAVWTKSYWSGNVLVIESRERQRFGTQTGAGVSWTSRWTLSPDGKELTIEKKIRTPDGEFGQRVVFVKQPMPVKKSE